MRFTVRESKLLNVVQNENLEINEVAKSFNVSTKTIKTDINKINEKIMQYESQIIVKNNVIYFESIYPLVHWKNIIRLNQTIEQVDLIFLKLLFLDDYITMIDFANELYMSKSKLEKMLASSPKLKKYVKKKRNVGIKIDLNLEDTLENALSTLIPYVDDLNYFVISRSLIMQVTETDVSIEQFKQYIDIFEQKVSSYEKVSDMDCKIIFLIILITLHQLELEEQMIDKFIGKYILTQNNNEKIRKIIKQNIIETLNENNIDITNNLFIDNLTLHIENSFKNSYINTVNSAMELRLKTEYSYAYSIAKHLYDKIRVTLNVDIAEYEINYISLYIQSLINKSSGKNKLQILIVCQYGLSVSNYIQVWLEENISFPLEFEICSVLDFRKKYEVVSNYNVIVTTIDNLEIESEKLIKVDTVPLDDQLFEVKKKIDEIYFTQQMKIFLEQSKVKTINVKSLDEINNLLNEDLAISNKRFIDEMKKRTEKGLTCVNGVMIMHSNGQLITTNKLVVYKLENPIIYDNNQIKLIFVLALTVDFIKRHNIVIRQLYKVIYSEEYVCALYESTTDKQFMWILKNQIKGR